MIHRDRDAAPSTLRDTVQLLTGRKIKLDKAIPVAVAVLDRIEAQMPVEPSRAALQEAILADADAGAIDGIVLEQLGFQIRRNAATQARLTAGQKALAAIRADATSIHGQLRALADDVIGHLDAVAALGEGVTLTGLVRDGRQDDANLVANVDIAAAELEVLHKLRRIVWEGKTFGIAPVDCSTWVDPTVAGSHGHGVGVAYILSALRGGARLHYPTPDEAVEAAQPIARRMTVLAAQQDQPAVQETITRPVMA